MAVRVFHHHRHHAPREVEGNLVQLLELLDEFLLMKVRTVQDRRVQQVLQARLEVADEVAIEQHLVGLASRHVAVPLQHHAVFGQRSGLIGAQHIHSAEVLNRVQPLDDHLLAAHGDRALGQADGDDHGQHLRREAHGHGHGKEEGFIPVVLGEAVDEKDERHHHRHKLNHQPGEATEAAVEAGRRLLLGDGAGHAAEIGVDSRHHHDRGGCSALHAGAEEAGVLQLGRRTRCLRLGVVELLHRHRFAGQRSLADEQVLGGEQAHIAGNHVAGGEVDHVSRHQVAQWKLARGAIAEHRRSDMDHGLELCRGRVRSRLLHESQRHAEQHHACHHGSSAHVARGVGDGREDRQQNHQRVAQNDQQADEPAARPLLRHLVRTHGARSGFGFRLREALGGRAQGTQQFIAVLGCRIEHRGRDMDVALLRLGEDLCRNYRLAGRLRSRRSGDACWAGFSGGSVCRAIRVWNRHRWFRRYLSDLQRFAQD